VPISAVGFGHAEAVHPLRGSYRLRRSQTAALLIVASLAVSAPVAMGESVHTAAAKPFTVSVTGANGVVRTTEPGLSCAEGGKGSYRHHFAEAPLGPGAMSNLAGTIRATLDVHYDGLGRPHPNAFLLGDESHVTLANQRGSVQIVLRRGSCQAPGVDFDGTTATGSGAWDASGLTGTGAYRDITGSGTFGFNAELNPGADNAWSLQLGGSLSVLQPGLTVKVEKTFWSNLGLDYLARVVTVVYRLANTGAGDSFGARFTGATGASGARACAEPPGQLDTCPNGAPPQQKLGDLASCSDGTLPASCDTELITVRYHLPLLGGPCALLILGCQFNTTIRADLPDALDTSLAQQQTVTVRAPDLPPPL
jgi:hypothetical protein